MIAILMLLCAAAFVALRFIGLGFVGCSYFVVNQQITPPLLYIANQQRVTPHFTYRTLSTLPCAERLIFVLTICLTNNYILK